jgi:hypothetical protein
VHLIVPFAAPLSAAGRDALHRLRLPNLEALLAHGAVERRDPGDEWTLAMPHERVLARALGWEPGDEPLPWAARAAVADGIDVGAMPWGLLTPAHWRVGSDAVLLADPALLALGETDSRALFDAVHPWFESEGFALVWGAPLRWYASHPSLAHLAAASIERVIGRNVDRWLPAQPEARLVRRLQNEAQMLLHRHPLNEARTEGGALAVNSFWLSGCGVFRPAATHDAVIDDRLRAPALAEDWLGWAAAWQALDATLTARPLTRLTLCGERAAVTLAVGRPTWWRRAARAFGSARQARDTLAPL